MRPLLLPILTLFVLAQPLAGQSVELWRPSDTKPKEAFILVEVHQITPAAGLRDVNDRGGSGGMIGIETGNRDFSLRFLLEAGRIPTQFADPANPGLRYTPLTWGGGFDALFHFGRGDLKAYALAGLRIDYWEATLVYGSAADSSSSAGRLGFRAGLGVNAGPFFVEARYRVSAGNLRLPSDQGQPGGSWSAVELGGGLRLRF